MEYLAAGRPILSTGAFEDEVSVILHSTGAGVATRTDAETEAYLADASELRGHRLGAVPGDAEAVVDRTMPGRWSPRRALLDGAESTSESHEVRASNGPIGLAPAPRSLSTYENLSELRECLAALGAQLR